MSQYNYHDLRVNLGWLKELVSEAVGYIDYYREMRKKLAEDFSDEDKELIKGLLNEVTTKASNLYERPELHRFRHDLVRRTKEREGIMSHDDHKRITPGSEYFRLVRGMMDLAHGLAYSVQKIEVSRPDIMNDLLAGQRFLGNLEVAVASHERESATLGSPKATEPKYSSPFGFSYATA